MIKYSIPTFRGVITHVGQVERGETERGAWMSQDYVLMIDDSNEKFPKSVSFRVFGEEKIKNFNIQNGEAVEVHLDFRAGTSARGNIFNNITAWKVERIAQQPSVQPQPQPQPQPATASFGQPQPQVPPVSPALFPTPEVAIGASGVDDYDLPF